ncbi:hypothetical protein [Desulfotruncus alcoholivorax]|uniref:hypothetical protein n=1 Tax=Desulfotruncus alcoholivorax TaxID=265477 RepID=UPI000481181F|nr:hypothetical protein [Desulfotruncus alcoholivorax]
MKNRKWLLTLVVIALGIAIVGVANAATVKASQTAPAQAPAAVQTSVTPEQVQQMIQNCWQLDQTMVDQWVKATGLSKEDLLKMEQAWMQGVMQQNPNLNTQNALKMQQTWMQNYLANYQPAKQVQQTQQTQQPKQVQQNATAPSNPPAQAPQYNNSNRQYYGWNCWNNGYGYGRGYCW